MPLPFELVELATREFSLQQQRQQQQEQEQCDDGSKSAPTGLSLFQARCCLMRTFGLDVPMREIKTIWLSLPSAASDEEILSGTIDLDTYLKIAERAWTCAQMSDTTLRSKLYEVFDRTHRGFVTQADLQRVLETIKKPRLASRSGELFAACDDLLIGKVSSTQVKQSILVCK